MTRRSLFHWAVRAGGALAAMIIAIPAILMVFSPVFIRARRKSWIAVGNISDFNIGEVKLTEISAPGADWSSKQRTKGVFVWRQTENQFIVFSRQCTDLSCPVVWDKGSECFYCPCHGGIFAMDGTPMAGPPPVPLYRYDVRTQNGVVEININSIPPMA